MGVKKKKNIGMSRNAYRWEKIEKRLIQLGYVRNLDDKDWYVWVDCVSTGTDIIYRLSNLSSVSRRGPFSRDGSFSEPVFEVMSSKDPTQVYVRCNTIEHAVSSSRR